ncbi:hypothetical protein AOLI_G00283750 [Acnodon oligacanthus]
MFLCELLGGGSAEPKVGTMPDSPADVKTQPRSTPPTMPPPPPAVSHAANRNASFTPTTRALVKFLMNTPLKAVLGTTVPRVESRGAEQDSLAPSAYLWLNL